MYVLGVLRRWVATQHQRYEALSLAQARCKIYLLYASRAKRKPTSTRRRGMLHQVVVQFEMVTGLIRLSMNMPVTTVAIQITKERHNGLQTELEI